MILLWLAIARGGTPVPPIEEVVHPAYEDRDGNPVRWHQVRSIARETDAVGRVRRRRLGRTALRVLFAGATAVEVWGTFELARRESYFAAPLGAQAGFTGLAAILLWTSLPQDLRTDRAELLNASNAWLRTHPDATTRWEAPPPPWQTPVEAVSSRVR